MSKRPKVLVTIRWPVGGIRTWCRYVYRRPEFEGFEIDVVLPAGQESGALVRDFADSGVAARVMPTGPSAHRFAAAVVSRLMRGGYALLHSHGFTSAVVGTAPARLLRVPHLVTIHETVLDHQYRDLRGQFVRRSIDAALRRVDCVHAVSIASRDNLRQAFPGAGQCRRGVQVLRNGIEPAGFCKAESSPVRERLGLPPRTILVGFFGRFMAPKGFRHLVDAVALHRTRSAGDPGIAVLAVGGGGFRREEEQRIRSLGLGAQFHFEDFMPDIAGVIKAVDVVAMPSLWEAGPLLPMEVLAAGVPLVVSDAAALREVVQDTPARVVPMKDAEALLRGILEMGSSEPKAIATGFAPVAARRFDVAETRRGMATLYRELIERHGVPSRAG